MAISADADGQMTISDGTSKKINKSGQSDYSKTREANIAQNKELLRQLGLDSFWGDEKDKANEKKGKKRSKDKKKDAARAGTR
jgi:hypothetical protein